MTMKHILFGLPGILVVVLSVLFIPGCTFLKKVDDPSLTRQLDMLLNKKAYFGLERQLDLHYRELSASRRLYFAAILDNVFNRNTSCIARIDSFMNQAPAGFPDSTVNAIFDTRANISSITRSYAEKLHLHLMDVHYREGASINGNRFTVGLGIADSLYIGQILVRNAVFQVMPDSILFLAPINFQMNVIVGLPVIADLQEVRVYNDGRMVIPPIPTPGDLHNMAFDGLDPIILLPSGEDTLLYHFDSGASSTILYATWFDTHRARYCDRPSKKEQALLGPEGQRQKIFICCPPFS